MALKGVVNKLQLYKDVGYVHGISPEEVQKAVQSQFQFVNRVMSRGKFEAILVAGVGVFRVKPGRLKYYGKENSKARDNGIQPSPQES